MKIVLTSVSVDDREKGLRFYTDLIGFEPKFDAAMGGEHRWLTPTSPGDPEGV